VLIEVADAGPGMSAEDAGRAFDRFHRAAERAGANEADQPAGMPGDGTRAGAGGGAAGAGSGLGLSIVQAIARAHGGQAVLESWPGHGTRVRIWLPGQKESIPAPAEPSPEAGPGPAPDASGRWSKR
jgi:two-component system OmpR family sensor kinase